MLITALLFKVQTVPLLSARLYRPYWTVFRQENQFICKHFHLLLLSLHFTDHYLKDLTQAALSREHRVPCFGKLSTDRRES